MADNIIISEDAAGYERLEITRRALKALAGIDGLQAGPLSPLASMRSPEGAAETDRIISAWEALDDTWRWAVPALLDPHRTIALVMGDGNTNLIGQYLFPDVEAYGPGFNVNVGGESVALTGPLSLGLLHVGLYSSLTLEDLPEIEPFRVDLANDHFWVLMAVLDAYRAAALELRFQRTGGAPKGVGAAAVVKVWTGGTSSYNPGWVVSLFSLLVPAEVPRDLPERLPRLLPEMVRKGHLLESAGTDGTLYALPEALDPLLWGPTTSLSFGLVSQRLAEPQTAELTVLGGWRTPGGVWLCDLSDLKSGVSLALVGPALAEEIIDDILGDDSLAPSWEEFAMETPYARDAMVSRLRAIPAGAVPAAAGEAVSEREAPARLRFCSSCGNELEGGLKFCNACGKPVQPEKPKLAFCPGCGSRLREGAHFCRECGRSL